MPSVICVYPWQVQRQADEIVGLLGVAQGFRQVTSGQKGIAARRVVAQVLHSLSRLGDALGGILPSQIYVQAAGQVLQAVLQTVIGRLTQNMELRERMGKFAIQKGSLSSGLQMNRNGTSNSDVCDLTMPQLAY